MDLDSDSGDFDGDNDSDYDYNDDGNIEMEFETEYDESEDFDLEEDSDTDIGYDLADQSVESTWSLWHADSDEQENGYWVESDQEDQPESDNVKTATESMAAQQKHSIEILEERSNLTVATGGHNRDKREWYSRQEYHSEDYDDEEDEEEDEDQDTPSKRINRLMAGLPRLFFAIPPEEGDYE